MPSAAWRRPFLFSVILFVSLSVMAGCSLVGSRRNQSATDRYHGGVFYPPCQPIGWIWPVSNGGIESGPVPYVPREGDILLTSSVSPSLTMQYLLLGRMGLPHHVALVVRKSDGCLAILETGAGGDRSVVFHSIELRLCKLKKEIKGGVVAVRPIRRALSDEESYRLTCFAEQQIGKPFSSNRDFLALMLPSRPVEATHNQQESWYCSELVVQALKTSGALVGASLPKSIVPEDLYHDERCDISNRWGRPQDWTWDENPTRVRPTFDPANR